MKNAYLKNFLGIIIQYLIIFPIVLIATALIQDDPVMTYKMCFTVLFAFLVNGFIATLLMGSQYRYIIGSLILVSSIWPFIFNIQKYLIILYVICLIFIIYKSIKIVQSDLAESIPSGIYYISFFAYFILFFFFKRIESINPYISLFSIAGLILLILGLFMLNRNELSSGARREMKVPKRIRRQNRFFVYTFILIVSIVAYFRPIVLFIKSIIKSIMLFIIRVIAFLFSLFPTQETVEDIPSEGSPNMGLPMEEVKPQSLFSKIIEWIFYIIAAAIILVAIAFLIYFLFKMIKMLYKKVKEWLMRNATWHDDRITYDDEKESILDLDRIRKDAISKMKKRIEKIMKRKEKFEDMKDNRERVRFLYRQFLRYVIKRGYPYSSKHTVEETKEFVKKYTSNKEILDENFVSIYNKARYSLNEIKNDDLKDIIHLKDNASQIEN